jgi:uncharacterized protein YdaU (DUF1376 family)
MHYYPFNLKDYLVETAHLPPMADLAYRRLLDLYYKEEAPIPNKPKWVANRIRLDSEEPIIGFVLREYFALDGTGVTAVWRHERADKEIAKYQKKAAVARKNGVLHVAGTKQEPKSDADRSLTKNHKPRTRNTPLPPQVGEWFECFWNEHPRKVGKPDGLKAYVAALARGATAEVILAGLRRHLPTWNAKKQAGEGDKIPHPSTWLNRDGWNDEVLATGGGHGCEGSNWWDTKRGVLDKGVALCIPGPADDSPKAWFDFMAAVWVAMGEGPWWDKTSVAYPIAVRLRDQGSEVTATVLAGLKKEVEHAN